MLKPLCGHEDGLEVALESFFTQQTSFPVRYVFGVADANDGAMTLCREIATRFPAIPSEFVIDSSVRGRNPKVSNLINMAQGHLGEIVVISDSDTVVAPGTLQAAIDSLAIPGTGAVTTLYRGRPTIANDPVRRFGAWNLDYWDLPMQVLSARLGPVAVAYGPLTAIRRDVLDKLGGLQVLADHLCDDAELGRRVHHSGYEVAFTPVVAETLVNDSSAEQLFHHELRWARTARGVRPLGYVASVVSHIGPVPLLLLLYPNPLSIGTATLPILLRWLLSILVVRRFGKADELATPGPLGLWIRDCASFMVWASGFMVTRVSWRGQSLPLRRHDLIRTETGLSK